MKPVTLCEAKIGIIYLMFTPNDNYTYQSYCVGKIEIKDGEIVIEPENVYKGCILKELNFKYFSIFRDRVHMKHGAVCLFELTEQEIMEHVIKEII